MSSRLLASCSSIGCLVYRHPRPPMFWRQHAWLFHSRSISPISVLTLWVLTLCKGDRHSRGSAAPAWHGANCRVKPASCQSPVSAWDAELIAHCCWATWPCRLLTLGFRWTSFGSSGSSMLQNEGWAIVLPMRFPLCLCRFREAPPPPPTLLPPRLLGGPFGYGGVGSLFGRCLGVGWHHEGLL